MLLPSWIKTYQTAQLKGDLIAGVIVAIVLIPQSMAYGLLAGLPAEVALYSSVLPIILYAAFGSSRTLAIGPVGIMSLMTGATIAELGISNIDEVINAANTLALLTGIILLLMRAARLGSIINFLSHPVVSGFISASAIIIALSQVKHIVGLNITEGLAPYQAITHIVTQLPQGHLATSILGVCSLMLLWWFKGPLANLLKKKAFNPNSIKFISNSGPLIVAVTGTLVVYYFHLNTRFEVSVVGYIPPGLPHIILPNYDEQLFKQLLPSALLIALIGYLESVSIAKSMAGPWLAHFNPRF